MKSLNKMRIIPLSLTLFLVTMIISPILCMAAQLNVNLGTTSSFAVLAGTTITNTGATTIDGDVGLYPGSGFPGQADVILSGAVHTNDNIAIKAKTDLVTAYDDVAGRTPVTHISSQLGGTTLTPGVYDSESGTFEITGTLTLDAQGNPDAVFLFKTATSLITASGSNVNLINSAQYGQVFWKVGSSATLGTNSHFVGHIFALTSIWANKGATIQGQLLARNGEVTLNNNTITNEIYDVSSGSSSSTTSSNSVISSNSTTSSNSVTSSNGVTSSNTVNPKTSDNNMNIIGLLLALVAISAVTVFVVHKKSTNS